MNFTLLHDVTFFALYGLAAVGAYVICERTIFYLVTLRNARRLVLVPSGELKVYAPGDRSRGVAGDMLEQFLAQRPSLTTRHEVEDVGEAAYLGARHRLARHLWVVDTLVTGAPLLGLLGTILGIIDTFQALATSGISDPGAVSRGIGTALFATALGIAIALVGLVANNFFQDKVERIADHLKVILLKAGQGPVVDNSPSTHDVRAASAGR
jgi:biopolymer transport protein ExbB